MKFFKCNVCGKIVAMVNEVKVPTMCCGKPMEELIANTGDGAGEKHVPVYEVKDGVVTVKVGSVDHPMIDAHYIMWIALETKSGNQRKILSPSDKPEATFYIGKDDEVLAVYEYCNLHGLYKA